MNSKFENIKNSDGNERIISLIDVYTFATQVLAKSLGDSSWNNGPTVTALKSGRIISANKLAKDIGISNSIKLPKAEYLAAVHGLTLKIFQQPAYPTGKPDQTIFRQAGYDVVSIIHKCTSNWEYPPIIEWVPQDEMYLDITEQVDYMVTNSIPAQNVDTINVGVCLAITLEVQDPPNWPLYESPENDKRKVEKLKKSKDVQKQRLSIGMQLINGIIKTIQGHSLLHCSGGISTNKMLAKIACSLNPPGSLSILSKNGISKQENSSRVPLKKLASLPSDLKRDLKNCGLLTMFDLQKISWKQLACLGYSYKEIAIIKLVSTGWDNRSVQQKIFSNNIRTGRNFFRPLQTFADTKWELFYLKEEFLTRCREQKAWHSRWPSKIQVTIQYANGWKSKTISGLCCDDLKVNELVRQMQIHFGIKRIVISGSIFVSTDL